MGKLAYTLPPAHPRRKVDPLSSLKMTLREHYQIKQAHYIIAMPASYERMLYRLFSDEPRYRSYPDAAQFLRHRRRDISHVVAKGTGVHRYTINHIMKQIIVRCRQRRLHLTMPERQSTYLTIATVTTKVMQIMKTGYHRIPL
jgi:hypothetical protein